MTSDDGASHATRLDRNSTSTGFRVIGDRLTVERIDDSGEPNAVAWSREDGERFQPALEAAR